MPVPEPTVEDINELIRTFTEWWGARSRDKHIRQQQFLAQMTRFGGAALAMAKQAAQTRRLLCVSVEAGMSAAAALELELRQLQEDYKNTIFANVEMAEKLVEALVAAKDMYPPAKWDQNPEEYDGDMNCSVCGAVVGEDDEKKHSLLDCIAEIRRIHKDDCEYMTVGYRGDADALRAQVETARISREIDQATIARLEAHIAQEKQGPDPDAPSPAFERWRCRAHTAEREIERLKGLLRADPEIVRLHFERGHVEGDIRHAAGAQILAEHFSQVLDSFKDASNYVEFTFAHATTGERYVLTLQRPGGKTPHALREEAEKQAPELRAGLRKALRACDLLNSHHVTRQEELEEEDDTDENQMFEAGACRGTWECLNSVRAIARKLGLV